MKESLSDFCPVPSEQLPVNEYEQLKNSWFFGLPSLEMAKYWQKLIFIWLLGLPIAIPIAATSFSWHKEPLFLFLSSMAGAGLLLGFVLLRLYLGWYYIRDRLSQERVFYEESGWYDGQIWSKPSATIARDRLIVTYQVEPILIRLRQTTWFFLGILALGVLLWQIAPNI
jgi:hypothetical protein